MAVMTRRDDVCNINIVLCLLAWTMLGTYQEKCDHDAGLDESEGTRQLGRIYNAGAPPCQYRLYHSAHLTA